MTVKEEKMEEYKVCVEVNQDNYGSAVIRFLERWADLLEEKIEKEHFHEPNHSIETVICKYADAASSKADTEGITGFMYGCAVNILSQVWIYGDILRKWHNKRYDYEGDGVVNPAILTIG